MAYMACSQQKRLWKITISCWMPENNRLDELNAVQLSYAIGHDIFIDGVKK